MDSSRHPLEAMVVEHKPSTPSTQDISVEDKPKAPSKLEFTDQNDILPHSIDLDKINRPALLLDSNLTIVWQNTQAMEKIWHNPGAWDHNMAGADIFDLFFTPLFKRNVADFTKSIEFFLFQIFALMTKEQLQKRIKMMDDDRKAVILSLLDPIDTADKCASIHGTFLRQTLRNGEKMSFEVFATNFSEGRLLVFESQKTPDNLPQIEQQQHIIQHFEKIRCQPEAIKTPYVLLAAQLNKASTLRTQMLADEYRRLINDLCQRSLYKIEQYGGVFGKHIESGFFVYFLYDPDRPENLLRIIECVLEIKKLMIDLGREWKIRKDWLHDVELNMGLHWEEEYIDILKSATGQVLASFGDGLQVAAAISQLAKDGQIWATKTLIQRLSTSSHKQLRFGILRPDRPREHPFIRNGFARISDVFDPRQTSAMSEEGYKLLPVTQIFDLSGALS